MKKRKKKPPFAAKRKQQEKSSAAWAELRKLPSEALITAIDTMIGFIAAFWHEQMEDARRKNGGQDNGQE